MKRSIAMLVIGLLMVGNVMAESELDYAAEDAGYEIIKTLSNRKLPVGRIAFLGLFGDKINMGSVIEAEMTRYPGIYEFYTRKEQDWNILTGEIEFGDRKSDIMDGKTIQKFGKIKGVEALLYGDVREASIKDGKGLVRLTVKLADVKTGQVLWSANIDGNYAGELQAPDRRTGLAVAAAAKKAAKSLAAKKDELGKVNIYLMPMNAGNVNLSDYVMPEFTKISDDNLKIFSGVAGQTGQRVVNKMAAELSSSGLAASDLKRVSSQLNQLFESEKVKVDENVRDVVLYGHFGEIEADDVVMSTAVLNLHLADLATGQELWGETAEGRVKFDWVYVVRQYWLYLLIGLAIVIGLGMFVRATSRPR